MITLSLNSGKLFPGNKKLQFVIFSAGVIFISFISIEAVIHVYLMKFYLQFGWSALFLVLIIFLIIVSPFIGNIYNAVYSLSRLTPALNRTVIKKQEPVILPEIKESKEEIQTPPIIVTEKVMEEPVQTVMEPVKSIGEDITEKEEQIQEKAEQVLLPEVTITKDEEIIKPDIKKPIRKPSIKGKTTKRNVKTKGRKK